MAVKLATMNDVLSKFDIFSTKRCSNCNSAPTGLSWINSNTFYGPEFEGILLDIPLTETEGQSWGIPQGVPNEYQIAWDLSSSRFATRHQFYDGTYQDWSSWKYNS